ncbi:hypothetical protein BDZ89DRAFT_943011 [Hymenopellis radicata]|nr:hypothetical protein BDZ89DRAFT_943011 [Hymenopellis radicata]
MTTFETGYGPIDEDGGQLFYTDSGAVPNSTTYKTVFLFHGSVVNGNIFRRLLPLAASNNLRVVIPNRRDYAGSTRYTNEELLLLQQGKREFFETVAANTISFISWFVKKHDVPTLSLDRTTGGIITIGWSMGTCTPLSMLAYPDAISSAMYATIEPYFKQMVLFDPPAVAFGSDTMPEYYVPFTDPELKSPEEMLSHFGVWVSSYYDHPDFASHSAEGLENRKHGDRNSLQNMTPEDMAATLDQIAAVRSELPM